MGRFHCCSYSEMSSTPSSLLFFFYLLIFSSSPWLLCFSSGAGFNLNTIAFDDGYTPLFGDFNLVRSPDGRSVRLLLDVSSGNLI